VCIIRVKPVGANTIGYADGRPWIVVDVSILDTSAARSVELQPGEGLPGAPQADLAAQRPRRVVERRRTASAAWRSPEVADRECPVEPPLGGVPLDLLGLQQWLELGPLREASRGHQSPKNRRQIS